MQYSTTEHDEPGWLAARDALALVQAVLGGDESRAKRLILQWAAGRKVASKCDMLFTESDEIGHREFDNESIAAADWVEASKQPDAGHWDTGVFSSSRHNVPYRPTEVHISGARFLENDLLKQITPLTRPGSATSKPAAPTTVTVAQYTDWLTPRGAIDALKPMSFEAATQALERRT